MLLISYLTRLIIKLKLLVLKEDWQRAAREGMFFVQNVVETVWTSRGRNWASHLGFQAYITPTSAVCSRCFGAVGVSKDQNSPQQTRSLWLPLAGAAGQFGPDDSKSVWASLPIHTSCINIRVPWGLEWLSDCWVPVMPKSDCLARIWFSAKQWR